MIGLRYSNSSAQALGPIKKNEEILFGTQCQSQLSGLDTVYWSWEEKEETKSIQPN